MSVPSMTSLERALTTLSHREPDRVPLFLLATMHGARELGLSIEEYFARPENVVEGQLRMRARYRNDCIYSFFYAAVEVEAWGADVLYREDGPPNAGAPVIRRPEDIDRLVAPDVRATPCLQKVIRATELLKESVGVEAPIIGVVMSPFSLPVMQLGFEGYLELMHGDPERLRKLLQVNQEFCVEWANAQVAAGATAICYFDPVSSPSIVPRALFLETGFPAASATLARIKGPCAIHLASGRCLPIVDDLVRAGAAAVGVSALEDLGEIKAACRGRLTVLGNLNGIEMRRWTPREAEAVVKQALSLAGPGGGFILSDNHGEIPWQVPEEVLEAVSDAVHTWGRYPLDWVESQT